MVSGLNFKGMSEKIPIYQFDEFAEKGSDIFLFHFSAAEIFQFATEASVPHRHDHYCCFFVENGNMDFMIDFKPVIINKQSMLISYPGQVHEVVKHQTCNGWVLAFDAKLINENAKLIIEESLTKIALISLNDDERDWFKKLFELIHSVINTNKKALFQAQLTRSLLDSFIYQASVLYQVQENTRIQEFSSRNIDITKKFRQLLQKNFKTMKKPSEYAEKMNFSVSYLNDTVKAVTGFPLTYFIQQEVVNEAQRLLYYSELSIKEVAYNLGYEDDKYFIRLFGKSTGSSPAIFRKNKIGRR
ncbi:AraC family transcriptional regulator [Dyadobacter frigoris]|uniref:Helix-turn-helix domain-containing protein n=2 Tax=Dyadobacter frigoris TaxID=2576211 RepID=A0A4U6CVV7_9BACT|nr:helix-turn-helix domain-containing protein [Dyadobacter frigoris]GLU56981.1 AraC family transcriptional regulator [Dyadobacter frigoris]